MTTRPPWLSVALLGSLLLVAASARRPAAPTPDNRDTLSRQFPLQRGGRVTLETTQGDIIVQTWNRDLVDVRAERTADSDEDLALVPVDIRSAPDQLDISSRVPAYAPDLRVRVDYRLRVPAQADLKRIQTDRGRVEITNLAGRAIVRVVNGAFRLRGFSGILDASTVNGEIDAVVARVNPGDFIKLETYNGDIRLRLPDGLRAHYALRTFNGRIESDVPLTVRNTFGPEVVHETNDVEEPLVRLTSVNGSISLTR